MPAIITAVTLHTSTAIALLVALTLARGTGQQAPPAPQDAQRPGVTFKVDINYVEIDAVVTDAQGRFVRGLTSADFELLEEGAQQTIAGVTLVEVPLTRADPPMYRGTVVEPDTVSNEQEMNGRVFVIVLDDLQTDFRRTPVVKAAARQFIQRYIGANDIVAIVQTGGNVEAAQELTNSRRRMLAAVDRFAGKKIRSATMAKLDDSFVQRSFGTGRSAVDTEEMLRVSHARSSLSTLKNLAEYLGGIRGRRKAVVWFSEGIDYDPSHIFEARDATTIRQAMQDAIASATRASVSFYGVDSRGLVAGLDESIDISVMPDDPQSSLGPTSLMDEVRRAQDHLRSMSSETGGFAIVNQNDLNNAFGRIVQDNSSYYLLGYYPKDTRRDGRFRSVDVRVKRPGLEVRARKGYTAARGRPASPPAPLATDASAEIRGALNSPLPVSGLNMSVFAAPFAGSSRKASIAVVVEFEPGQLKFVEKDGQFVEDLEVVALAVDANARMQGGGRDQAPLRLSKRGYDAVMQGGLRLTRRMEVPPGRYQIRVGARESNGGSVGSVSLDLDVPDFSKAPLHMSGIAIASVASSGMITPNPDPGLKDVLPGPATARRTFPRSDVLTVFTEVYDNQRAAHRVAIRSTVTADNGAVVFSASGERASEELAGAKGGGYGHTVTIPLKDMAPGRYVLRIAAETLLSKGATASREVEFRVQ